LRRRGVLNEKVVVELEVDEEEYYRIVVPIIAEIDSKVARRMLEPFSFRRKLEVFGEAIHLAEEAEGGKHRMKLVFMNSEDLKKFRGAVKQMSGIRQRILEFVEERGEVWTSLVAEELGISRWKAWYHLTLLVAEGKIERMKKCGRWFWRKRE